ncbi:hypothetical protein N9S33_03400 [Candidatus Actinomarina]|jgi:hypothetical protein|nr:hypothetical protein [Candidatus Actinomarina sp.]
MKISSSKIFKRLVLIFLISLLFKSVWLFDNQSLGQPGNDDLSYWLHAATVVYDHDFSYVEDFKVREGVFDVDTNTPYHPPGAGYLSSPFVYLFSLLDESDPERLNPVGYFAYLGFFAASLFYFLAGMYLIAKILRKRTYKLHNIILFSGFTGTIAHFVTTRFFMSHSTEFFLCACICYIFETTKNRYSLKNLTILCGLYLILSFTRPSTFIYSLCLFAVYSSKYDYTLRNIYRVGITSSVFSGIHIVISNFLYKEPTIFHNAQINVQQQGFSEISIQSIILSTPKLLQLFYSPSMGIIWVIPVVFFGIISILHSQYRKPTNFISNLFVFLYFYGAFIVLIVWEGREVAFGQRLLIGLIPFCLIKIGQYDKPKIFNFIFGLTTIISYLGYLYFYSSTNLTLKPGQTLWGTNVGFAGENYFIYLINEIPSLQNIFAVLGKTIYSVNFFHLISLDTLIKRFPLQEFLTNEKFSEAVVFSEKYSNIDGGYLFLATLLIFIFSILLSSILINKSKFS